MHASYQPALSLCSCAVLQSIVANACHHEDTAEAEEFVVMCC